MPRFCSVSTFRQTRSNSLRFIHRPTAKKRISLPALDRGVDGGVLVYHSPYHDPFLNLAYENWMYENLNLEKHDVLLFWRNSPCVVVGRHQNPWLECSVEKLRKNGVQLARRYSGGGTVYHDMGNLNITFLTNRERYNRKRNLESISQALFEGWGLDVQISPRDDLLVDGMFKVSGSAAKLGKQSSYHHCTLLLDADLEMLNKAVRPSGLVAATRSTQSVSSNVINLKDLEPLLNFDEIITGVARTYSQGNVCSEVLPLEIFQEYTSEIDQLRSELRSWEWVFGKTSKFTLNYSVPSASEVKTDIQIEIVSGIVKDIKIDPNVLPGDTETTLKGCLIGERFMPHSIKGAFDMALQTSAYLLDNRTETYIRDIVKNILNFT